MTSGQAVTRNARRPPVLLLAASIVPVLLIATPLALTIVDASALGLDRARALLFRPLVFSLLGHTVALIVAVSFTCGVIGTAAAWFVERTALPGARIWGVLAAVPLAIPAFISSYAWVSISSELQGFYGAWLVVSFSYYPLVYLPVAAALRGMDPALEDSARALGLAPARVFLRIVLPQLRPALLGAMLLVALNTLVEFGAFTLLRFRTFTTELYAEYRTGSDGPETSLLAVVLIALCLVCLGVERQVRGDVVGAYARIGGGTQRGATRVALGLAALPVIGLFATLAVTAIGVPLGTIVFWLTRHNSAAFAAVQVSPRALFDATMSSVELGLAGATATTALALPLAFLAARFGGGLVTSLDRAAYLAQGVPGIVVALALITLALRAVPFLYQSDAMLIVAYAIVFLPLALVALRTVFARARRAHEEAARTLGLGWFHTARRVVLPIAAAGIGAAGAMVFISVVTELTATLLLAPIGTTTLATQIWADTSTVAFAAAAPYAALMAGLSLLSAWLLARRFGAVVDV